MGTLSLLSGIESLIYILYEQGELSSKLVRDKHYAFWQFYELRTVLLILIANCLLYMCSKARKHDDGTMFNDDFILVINTALGNSSHHLKAMYFDDLHIEEVSSSPKYDGYTPEDNLNRIKSIIVPNNYIQTEQTIPYRHFEVAPNEYNERMAYHINSILEILRSHNKIDLNDIKDGHHSFELLYRERRVLLNILCGLYKDLAYKSKFDKNGDPLPEDKFLIGIRTQNGDAFQVFNTIRFNEFDLPSLEAAPINSCDIITNDHDQLDIMHEDFIKNILSLKIRKYYE